MPKINNVRTDPYLTVNSLALLGFNTDDYHGEYLGLAREIPPITVHSFDKENETASLCILHFLLVRLDHKDFLNSICNCWPYLDNRTKNEFKRCVCASLERLLKRNLFGSYINISSALRNQAQSSEIWALLRLLSDLCLDSAIQMLHRDGEFVSNAAVDVLFNDSFNCEAILDCIASEEKQLENLLSTRIAQESRQKAYMEELDSRLKKAKYSLATSQKRIRNTMKEGKLYVITDAGQNFRTEKIQHLQESKKLLQQLTVSALITETTNYLQAENLSKAKSCSGEDSMESLLVDIEHMVQALDSAREFIT